MARITYIEFDGLSHTVEVSAGDTVMQGAMDSGIQGIVAECGGGLSCATCLCTVDSDWTGFLAPASEMERDLLEFVDVEIPNESRRLSCQIVVSDDLDGLVVSFPQVQY